MHLKVWVSWKTNQIFQRVARSKFINGHISECHAFQSLESLRLVVDSTVIITLSSALATLNNPIILTSYTPFWTIIWLINPDRYNRSCYLVIRRVLLSQNVSTFSAWLPFSWLLEKCMPCQVFYQGYSQGVVFFQFE